MGSFLVKHKQFLYHYHFIIYIFIFFFFLFHLFSLYPKIFSFHYYVFALYFSPFFSFFFYLLLLILFFSFFLYKHYCTFFIYYIFEYILLLLLLFILILTLTIIEDLFLFFLILEFLNLIFIIFLGFFNNTIINIEAIIKYFFINLKSGCLFLSSLTLIYLSMGSFNLIDISLLLNQINLQTNSILISSQIDFFLFAIGLLFFLIALLLKIGIFPIHNWLIDLYNGSAYVSLFSFSILSKIAVSIILFKILQTYFIFFNFEFHILFLILIIIGLFFSSLQNIYQFNIKRFLAISSIAQFCYFLFALSLNTVSGLLLAFFLLIFYLLNSCALFFYLTITKKIYNYKNLIKIQEFMFLSNSPDAIKRNILIFFFFIFIGVPPFFNFIIKFGILHTLLSIQSSFYFFFSFFFLLFSSILSFLYLRCIRLLLVWSSNFFCAFRPWTSTECIILFFFILFNLFILFYPDIIWFIFYISLKFLNI